MSALGDFWVSFALLANVGVTLACVIYGVVNWNKGDK